MSANKPIGRPSQLKDPVRGTILSAVRMGCPAHLACQAAGISYRTYQSWTRQGRDDEDARRDTAFSAFLREMREAKAAGLVDRLKAIKRAVRKGDGWLALRFAQATHPEDFADNRGEIKSLRRELADLMKKLDEINTPKNPPSSPAPVESPTPSPAPS